MVEDTFMLLNTESGLKRETTQQWEEDRQPNTLMRRNKDMVKVVKNNDLTWEPLSDEFFESPELLRSKDLDLIEANLMWSCRVIELCGPNDQDVVEWHNKYIEKIYDRIASNYRTVMIMKGRRI